MPVQATVILDSGCMLPGDAGSFSTEVGYYKSNESAWDIRVVADGQTYPADELRSLGDDCLIEVRHIRADGTINQDGALASDTFHGEILHMSQLYGEDAPVAPGNFDCVIRFDSGLFCGALLKPRQFKLHRQQPDGQFTYSPTDEPKLIEQPIAHNIHVHFKLEDDEELQLVRNNIVFWSSSKINVTDRLEVEIIADNSTAEKFYRLALHTPRDSYWLPNQGDPPPVCAEFPCKPPARSTI
ncbi:MAG TPA: hypothetical protein VJZ91_02815 [Blastocatellia bacterium]|nr:hypothetical protein [Blastocatellia bacterium]